MNAIRIWFLDYLYFLIKDINSGLASGPQPVERKGLSGLTARMRQSVHARTARMETLLQYR